MLHFFLFQRQTEKKNFVKFYMICGEDVYMKTFKHNPMNLPFIFHTYDDDDDEKNMV